MEDDAAALATHRATRRSMAPGGEAARRRRVEAWTEIGLEWLIRLCGISAILFVFGIFFFVFREGAGLLFGDFSLIKFLFTTEWYPTSQSNVRYGVLSLIAG